MTELGRISAYLLRTAMLMLCIIAAAAVLSAVAGIYYRRRLMRQLEAAALADAAADRCKVIRLEDRRKHIMATEREGGEKYGRQL